MKHFSSLYPTQINSLSNNFWKKVKVGPPEECWDGQAQLVTESMTNMVR